MRARAPGASIGAGVRAMNRRSRLFLLVPLACVLGLVVVTAAGSSTATGRIVFVQNHLCLRGNDCGLGEIAVVSADGSRPTVLTHDKVTELSPKWSPDGRAIAYVRPTGRVSQVWLMNADGGGRHALTHLPQGVVGGTEWSSIDWSPDGSRIAFIAYRNNPNNAGASQLWVANARTGAATLLLPMRIGVSSGVDSPAWSPDGRWIALTRTNRHTPYQILLFSLATHRLSGLGQGTDPAWSPDGRRIVFTGAKGMLHVMDPNGKHVRSLKAYGSAPSWSPDGQWIVFDSNADNENLAEIRPNGTGYHLITHLKPKWLSIEPDW